MQLMSLARIILTMTMMMMCSSVPSIEAICQLVSVHSYWCDASWRATVGGDMRTMCVMKPMVDAVLPSSPTD